MNGNATSLPDDELNIRRDYRPDQYTPRPQIQTAHRWFHDRKKQLLTVVALPATGKTWFLRRLQEEFDDNGIVKTLWIKVDDLLSPEMRHGRTREVQDIAEIHKHAWFRDFKKQLATQCPDMAALSYAETDDIAELVEALANEICQNCFAGQQVVLFIDNGDILSDPGWREFERTIIEPFAREKSLRLIVAAREDQKIETFLLKANQQRLILDDLEDEAGEQQMQKLAQEFPMAAPRVSHLLKAIPAYTYSHAGLNTFLYLYADKYPDAQPDRHFLRAMIDVLNRFSEDPDELIELLEAIADYADEWVIEQMAEWQCVSNTEAWERASKLIDNWLVVNISRNRYKIVDGVREFVRVVLKLRTTLAVAAQTIDPTQVISELGQRFTAVTAQNVRQTNIFEDKVWMTLELPANIANEIMQLYQNKRLIEVRIIEIHYQANKLLHLISNRFNVGELRELCRCLNINYENLAGGGKREKVLDLIEHCERRAQLPDLLRCCQQMRPDAIWQI